MAQPLAISGLSRSVSVEAEVIICIHCGEQNNSGDAFCGKCGAFLEWSGEAVEQPGPTPPRPGVREADRLAASPMAPEQAIATTLVTPSQTVDPGSQIAFTLAVINRAQTVDQLSVEVLGDAAAWAEVDPPSLNLMPGMSGTATIRFHPPRSPEARTGRVHFGIRVNSSEHPDASVVERGILEITPFTELELDLSPRVVHGRRGGSFTVRAANGGNVPASLALAGIDPEQALGFKITPPTLHVEPGATAIAKVAVSAGGGAIIGSSRQRPFQIVASPAGGAKRPLDGVLAQSPLLPFWVPAAVVAAAVALVVFVVAKPFGPGVTPQPSPAAAVTSAPSSAPTPTAAAPSTAGPTPTATASPTPTLPPTPPPAWWEGAVAAATAQGLNLGDPANGGTTAENLRYQEFTNGAVYERTSGAYALSDAIWRKWKTLGGGAAAPAELGYPSSPLLGPDLGHRRQLFDKGAIYWTAATDARVVYGPLWAYWKQLVSGAGGDVTSSSDAGLIASDGYPTGDLLMGTDGKSAEIYLERACIGVDSTGKGWQGHLTSVQGSTVCLAPMTIAPFKIFKPLFTPAPTQ